MVTIRWYLGCLKGQLRGAGRLIKTEKTRLLDNSRNCRALGPLGMLQISGLGLSGNGPRFGKPFRLQKATALGPKPISNQQLLSKQQSLMRTRIFVDPTGCLDDSFAPSETWK